MWSAQAPRVEGTAQSVLVKQAHVGAELFYTLYHGKHVRPWRQMRSAQASKVERKRNLSW